MDGGIIGGPEQSNQQYIETIKFAGEIKSYDDYYGIVIISGQSGLHMRPSIALLKGVEKIFGNKMNISIKVGNVINNITEPRDIYELCLCEGVVFEICINKKTADSQEVSQPQLNQMIDVINEIYESAIVSQPKMQSNRIAGELYQNLK